MSAFAKRFYKAVEIVEEAGRYGITLDGRRLRTPAKRPFLLPTEALARAIAEEWDAQQGEIRPDTMGLMKLAGTALDHVAGREPEVAAEAARFASSDLLCYRAHHPEDLVELEMRSWQPLLDWAALRFDAPLVVVTGIRLASQHEASLRALHAAVAALDALRLTALADLTAACGSLILALAVLERRIDGDQAFDLSQLDETYEIERWGEDSEAAAARVRLRRDIGAAARFLRLLDGA